MTYIFDISLNIWTQTDSLRFLKPRNKPHIIFIQSLFMNFYVILKGFFFVSVAKELHLWTIMLYNVKAKLPQW